MVHLMLWNRIVAGAGKDLDQGSHGDARGRVNRDSSLL